jgi:hypothetical protein
MSFGFKGIICHHNVFHWEITPTKTNSKRHHFTVMLTSDNKKKTLLSHLFRHFLQV